MNTFFKDGLRWLLLFLLCAWCTWNLVIASKLKSFSLIILKKTTPIYLSIILIKNRKNHFMFAFYLMFLFFFKFLLTSLIVKELIKHKNKFNKKVFHDRENSENRFSEFSYFMKGFKKYIWTFSLHNETLSWNTYFMKCSEINISQCILAIMTICLQLLGKTKDMVCVIN